MDELTIKIIVVVVMAFVAGLMTGSGVWRMSKKHAYAYEAGYRDGSIHYELDHCPACKNVADLQEALAENEPHECYFKWSLADNGWADHTCSKCGFVENTDVHVVLDWNYCPNCGRKVVSK